MLDFNISKETCTGCGACFSICPVGCIEMVPDEEGFLYPVASDKCIKCGKCKLVCPRIGFYKNNLAINPKCFVMVSKEKKVWKASTSGGAFWQICSIYGNDDTVVFGAAWDGFEVIHKYVVGVKNIGNFQKSKYVSSNLKNVFCEVKHFLSLGKKVIFSGTPCQVAGLKIYLGKDYKTLLLIDFICHGVGSPAVFKKCLDVVGEQFGIKPTGYCFREKPKNFFISRYISSLSYGDKKIYLTDTQYDQLFLKQLCTRPSCGKNCIFKNDYRQSDITLADYNGSSNNFPLIEDDDNNYSTIIANSEKGLSVVSALNEKTFIHELSFEDVKKNNPLFCEQFAFDSDRDGFFRDFVVDCNSVKKWTHDANKLSISAKTRFFNLLPIFLKRRIRRCLNEKKR